MQLPNLEADNATLWLELQQHKILLKQFADLALIEDQSAKDHYHQAIYNYLYPLQLDSIKAGFYIKTDTGYFFDRFKNACLAEWLLAAGKTFFDGQLSYLGLAIYQHLRQFTGSAMSTVKGLHFEQRPFQVSGSQLKQNLSPQALDLAQALLDINALVDEQTYLISYKVQLNQAAANIDMHYKQAQITESALQQTLLALTQTNYQKVTQPAVPFKTDQLDWLCQQLTLNQTAAFHFNQQDTQQQTLPLQQQMQQQLTSQIPIQNHQSAQQWQLCYSALISLQTYFDLSLFDDSLQHLAQLIANFCAMPSSHTESAQRIRLIQVIQLRCLNIIQQYLNQQSQNAAFDQQTQEEIDIKSEQLTQAQKLVLQNSKQLKPFTKTDFCLQSLASVSFYHFKHNKLGSTEKIQQLSASYDPTLVIFC
jgi:hypothetical protein